MFRDNPVLINPLEIVPEVNPLLSPHGRTWVEIDGVEQETYPDRFIKHSTINWRRRGDILRRKIDYFFNFFPM